MSEIKKMTFYSDGSHVSTEILEELKKNFPDARIKITYRLGSSDFEVPAIATANSIINGAKKIRLYCLRNEPCADD